MNTLRAITGAPSYEYKLTQVITANATQFFDGLLNTWLDNFIVVAQTLESQDGSMDLLNSCGLRSGTTYSVLTKMQFTDLSNGNIARLILMRDPFGFT